MDIQITNISPPIDNWRVLIFFSVAVYELFWPWSLEEVWNRVWFIHYQRVKDYQRLRQRKSKVLLPYIHRSLVPVKIFYSLLSQQSDFVRRAIGKSRSVVKSPPCACAKAQRQFDRDGWEGWEEEESTESLPLFKLMSTCLLAGRTSPALIAKVHAASRCPRLKHDSAAEKQVRSYWEIQTLLSLFPHLRHTYLIFFRMLAFLKDTAWSWMFKPHLSDSFLASFFFFNLLLLFSAPFLCVCERFCFVGPQLELRVVCSSRSRQWQVVVIWHVRSSRCCHWETRRDTREH